MPYDFKVTLHIQDAIVIELQTEKYNTWEQNSEYCVFCRICS